MRDTYTAHIELKDGPLAGQFRELRMAYGRPPPKFAQFMEKLEPIVYLEGPMALSIRVYTYKSTLWRKGWNEWYEWTYVEEI